VIGNNEFIQAMWEKITNALVSYPDGIIKKYS